jgi:hypothetical protein
VKPEQPPQPVYVSSTDEEIVLALARSPDDGGAVITDYELHIDEGALGSAFTKLATYDYATDGFSFTVSAADNSLMAGLYYQFKYRAYNELGFSEFSNELMVGLGALPSAPNNPARSEEGNSATSIGLTWDSLSGEMLEVTAYSLYMDDG